MNGRFFIDTNIVTYAHISNESTKHKKAIELFKNDLLGSQLWMSTQILSEFYSVMSKNTYEHELIVKFISVISREINILPVTLSTVNKALNIK